MSNVSKKRNHTLNYIKALACICVVMIHCSFPGVIGKVIYGFSRFAVPCFFMISGYFVYCGSTKKDYQKLAKKVKHIGILLLGTEITYLLWHIIDSYVDGGLMSVFEWFSGIFSMQSLFRLLIFQTTPIGDVSWFLLALLLCYLVAYPIAKNNLWKKTAYLIPTLLVLNIFIGEILPFLGVITQWFWCSNFWLLGFPFFALGYWIRLYQDRLLSYVTQKRTVVVVIISVVIILIERIFTDASQLFIGNIICVLAFFLFSIKYPDFFSENKLIEFIGDKLSFYVYILHPIVRDIYGKIFEALNMSQVAVVLWLKPIVVVMVSIIIAGTIYFIKDRVYIES